MEGWLAVTVSGLVTVSLLKPGGALLTASESLCRLRGRVALADIAFTGGGNIVVAATDGSSSSPVQFYKVRTKTTLIIICRFSRVAVRTFNISVSVFRWW